MARITDPWDHHAWDSTNDVADWAAQQDEPEMERQKVFDLIARTLPPEQEAAITIRDGGRRALVGGFRR